MRIGIRSLVLVGMVGLIAACGGSNKSASSPSTKTASTSKSAAASTSKSTAPASTVKSGAATGSSSTLKGNCRQYANLNAAYRNAVVPSGGTFSLSAAVKADQIMANASPSPIHADAEYVVGQIADLANTFARLGYKPGTPPTASQTAGLQAAAARFRQPRLLAAVQHIKAWVNQGCPS